MEQLGCNNKMDQEGRCKRNNRKRKRKQKIPSFAQTKMIPFGVLSPNGHTWKNPIMAATPLEARLEARRLLLTRVEGGLDGRYRIMVPLEKPKEIKKKRDDGQEYMEVIHEEQVDSFVFKRERYA